MIHQLIIKNNDVEWYIIKKKRKSTGTRYQITRETGSRITTFDTNYINSKYAPPEVPSKVKEVAQKLLVYN
jgi:hypothetical protein